MYQEFEDSMAMIGEVAVSGEALCPEDRSVGFYLCTLKKDHPGLHEASGLTGLKYAQWDDDRSTD